jgi:hypothetical protein
MRFPYEFFYVLLLRFPCEIVCCLLHNFLKRFHSFLPFWDVLLKFVAFCCILFWRDFLMRFHAFLAVMRFLDEISCFLAAEFSFWWCDVRTVEADVEGCGSLSEHDGLLDVVLFCVCKLGGSLAWDECKLGGGWWKCECVGRQKKLCQQHALHQVDTWPEHALVMQGGSLGGLGQWRAVCNLKSVCLLWAVTVFGSGLLLSPSFLARWLWL